MSNVIHQFTIGKFSWFLVETETAAELGFSEYTGVNSDIAQLS